jgi:hypothetical protein
MDEQTWAVFRNDAHWLWNSLDNRQQQDVKDAVASMPLEDYLNSRRVWRLWANMFVEMHEDLNTEQLRVALKLQGSVLRLTERHKNKAVRLWTRMQSAYNAWHFVAFLLYDATGLVRWLLGYPDGNRPLLFFVVASFLFWYVYFTLALAHNTDTFQWIVALTVYVGWSRTGGLMMVETGPSVFQSAFTLLYWVVLWTIATDGQAIHDLLTRLYRHLQTWKVRQQAQP